ncbi:MAG: CinA family protein, partial [Prevotella sp.]|nr:CinA family protein [Prevotella sp.]
DIRTIKLTEDNGRDRNLAAAASTALRLFLEYIKEKNGLENEE